MVEKLIRAGHLRRYIQETVRIAEAVRAIERLTVDAELLREPRPTINYILGTDDQYQSKHQKKRLLHVAIVQARINKIHAPDNNREVKLIDDPISFPPINRYRVIVPHHDALVLTLCINDLNVHKVFVDLGGVTNLLQLPAFKQMNVSLDRLSSAGRILSSFNGASTVTMGDITLPIRARPVVQQVLFSVVGDLSPYNSIVGRAWLHAMKVVSFTYHQMISYLTNAGQVDLWSSQLAAR